MFVLIVWFVAYYHNAIGFSGEYGSEGACEKAFQVIQRQNRQGSAELRGHICIPKS